jgi:hypothetical protein
MAAGMAMIGMLAMTAHAAAGRMPAETAAGT